MDAIRQSNGWQVDVQRDQRAPDTLCLALPGVRSWRFSISFPISVLHVTPSLVHWAFKWASLDDTAAAPDCGHHMCASLLISHSSSMFT